MKQILLVGNPNCGKTTLFNALTGDRQRVGNWPGVTVEKKTGMYVFQEQETSVTDLPGIYSLSLLANGASQDEQIAATAIASLPADVIINVIDACHLERHLYLTTQLLELGKPVILAVNMIDIAAQRGIELDFKALSSQLNCPVVPLQAHKKMGVDDLKQAIARPVAVASPLPMNIPDKLLLFADELQQSFINEHKMTPQLARYYVWRTMEGDTSFAHCGMQVGEDFDIILADSRYQAIHRIAELTQRKSSDASEHLTAKIDRVVLHRFWALPIFFAMMYLMFLFAINIGGAFQDFFDISSNAIFVQGSAWLLAQLHIPQWIIAVVANGIGVGITTTLTFIPVIAAMFFFLALLEASGYMARAAFVVDRVMRALGLPGKSFVPMIVGFGCNVPAIMAARTLDSDRDRLLTVLMSPFMSCSARLAIYAVFVAAFFPTGGQNVVFSLYLIGILMAVFTGFILRKTSLRGESSPLILELPAYHKPGLRRLFKETGMRLKLFITRAGRMIVPVCVILGGLNALTLDGGFSAGEASSNSVLSLLGQWLTPLFSPMGLEQNNWPATVGLLTGMLAKEVVVGSLNTLYTQAGHFSQAGIGPFDFLASLQTALLSIPKNLMELGHAVLNPVLASAPDSEMSQSVYGVMVEQFDGKVGAFAYLLFILLYIPCVSTMAAIRQESSRQWMWFSVAWSFLIAYAAAVMFYQLARIPLHPQQSLLWVAAMIAAIAAFVLVLYNRQRASRETYVTANP